MAVRKPKEDPAHAETEKIILEMEKRLAKEYAVAEREVQAKIDDYFDRFRLKDQKWREWVKDGTKTKQEYQQWRIGQMAVGKRWENMKETIAEDYHHANDIARSIVRGYLPEVYATNFNYGTYEAEMGAKIDTSFTLYSRESVERIMRDDPKLLPDPGRKKKAEIAAGKDIAWNRQQVQSVMIQGILQGESIPKLANRLAKEVGERDHRAAIRNARTMATGAQNAGRVDAYKRAESMGIDMEDGWIATLDMRTRHEHRELDGQRQKVGDSFVVPSTGEKIRYPGDPQAPGHLIYSCRCTIRGFVKGLEPQARKLRDTSAIEGMTYDEWKASKKSKSNPITLPEEKGEAIAESYLNEYRKGGKPEEEDKQPITPQEPTKEQPKEPEKPKREEFKFEPASTIQEAEEYAKSFVNDKQFGALGVSYKGVGLDVANSINETIGKFFYTYNVEKFGGVFVPKGNTKLGQLIQGAHAAYSPARNSFLINSQNKSLGIVAKNLAEESRVITDYLNNPNKYDTNKMSRAVLDVLLNSAESGRGTVPDTMTDIINHELGHSLEKAIKKLDNFDSIKDNMKDYASKISGYSTENMSEYIAESFCSYQKGEDKIDPELVKAFKELER